MKIRLAIFLMVTLLFTACSGPKNETIREATEIHISTVEKYVNLKSEVDARLKKLKMDIDAADSSNKERVKDLNAFYKGLIKSNKVLDNWENSLVGVPGMEPHSHGNDENGNVILIEEEKLAERVSDEEVLSIQKGLNKKLIEIEKQIRDVFTQLENYHQ